MAQWLRALVALTEGTGSTLRTHRDGRYAHLPVTPVSGIHHLLLASTGACTQAHTHRDTNGLINKNKVNLGQGINSKSNQKKNLAWRRAKKELGTLDFSLETIRAGKE